jgi:enoyl-CoA hydratase/carnithine racemase
MPYGEVMRMSLMGTAERIFAHRAYETGLVSEVVPGPALLDAALRAAAVIASHPTEAVQGTVRAVWSAREAARAQALAHAPHLIALGNLPSDRQTELFTRRSRHFRVR